MKCLQCQELYKVIPYQPYYTYWCKLFKAYLIKDNKDCPIQCSECQAIFEENK